MNLIEHADILDLRDIAEALRDAVDPHNEHDADDIADTERACRSLLDDIDGMTGSAVNSPEQVAERLAYLGDNYGATMIANDYFVTYAEQLADDVGAINKDAGWPLNHIDWDAAADSLKQDYSSVTFDGTDYLIRSW